MADVLTTLMAVFGLIFVVGSMLVMGFSLTPKMIVQPLRIDRTVIISLNARGCITHMGEAS